MFSLRDDFPDVFHRLVTSPPGTEIEFALEPRHFPSFLDGRDRHLEAGSASLRILTQLRALPETALAIGRKAAVTPQPVKKVMAPDEPENGGVHDIGVVLFEFDLGSVFKTPLDEGGVSEDVVGSYVIKLETGVVPQDLKDIVLRIGYRLVEAAT